MDLLKKSSTRLSMFFLYSIVIKTYGFLISIASLFSQKANHLHSGRKNQWANIEKRINKWSPQKKIWIHAASYGEYEMAKPIINKLQKNKKLHFIISFHSPSGYENTVFEDSNFLKIYLPLDTFSNQQRLVNLIKPDKVVFIKYEFWFNLLRVLNNRSIPYYYSSLHLNSNSYLFKPFFSPFLDLLKKSRTIYCHNENSLEVLEKNGFENIQILGDTRIAQTIENRNSNTYKFSWPNERNLSIALGSIIPSEYELISKLINGNPQNNYLLAPHDVDRKTIEKLKVVIEKRVSLYSEMNPPISNIVVVDTLGDLKYLYKFCNVAYVGAGFDKGPHNVLEPLVYGLPTLCGPNIEKFPMSKLLAKKELLKIVHEQGNVTEQLLELCEVDLHEFEKRTSAFFQNAPDNLDILIKELST